jgi:signal transduction histidine kinase
MTETTMGRSGAIAERIARIPPLVLDTAIALLFCAIGVFETSRLVGPPSSSSLVDQILAVGPVALIVIGTLSLALRRRFPLTVVLVATVTLALNEGADDTATSWVTMMIAAFSAGLQGSQRRHVTIAFTTLAAMVTGIWLYGFATHSGDPSFIALWIMVLAIWWVGDIVRTRTRQAADLRAQTIRLEMERELEAERAAAAERARIARELHDVIAHSLSVIVIQAAAARLVLDRDPAKARESLDAVEQTGRTAMVEMRRLLGVVRRDELHAAPTAPQPSLASLDGLVREIEEAGLQVDLRVEGAPRALPPGVDVSAFRIVQEALTNALRHAHASRTEIKVRYLPDALEVQVLDDGQGAPPQADDDAHVGHGIVGMRERVSLLRGELDVGPGADGGFLVRARLPAGPTAAQ